MTLTKLSPTLGLAMKAGKIMRVGWGEYALPESGLAAYISPNRLLVELVIGAPDYPPAEDTLVAAMRMRGHTDDGTYHSLAWLRKSGIFAPRRDGRVALSAESVAKRERGEELRDGRGAVLWAPPLVVPAEVATWESRLIDATRGGTPGPGNGVPLKAASSAAQRRAVKLAAREKCLQWLIESIRANPKLPPSSLRELANEAKLKFGTVRRTFEGCLSEAQTVTKNWNWSKAGRRPE